VRDMQARAFALQLEVEPDHEPFDIRPAEIGIHVDVAYGEHDVEDFVAIARRLADEIPDATLHTIPGAGHLPALEQPDAVAALL
jgi:3-oxoadipate enol-lactonase